MAAAASSARAERRPTRFNFPAASDLVHPPKRDATDMCGFTKCQKLRRMPGAPSRTDSDHALVLAEVKVQSHQFITASLNVSNKKFHAYFGANSPYSDLGMLPADDDAEGVEWLQTKTRRQVKDLLERVQPDVLFLQEMSSDELALLEGDVEAAGYDCFSFDTESAFLEKQRAKGEEFNLAVTLTKRSMFKTERQQHVRLEDIREQQTSPDDASLLVPGTYVGRLELPVVTVSFVAEPRLQLDVWSVHLRGVDHQHPEASLTALRDFAQARSMERGCLFGGDFNAPDCDVGSFFGPEYAARPVRFTHVNPRYYAVVYDHLVGLSHFDLTVDVKLFTGRDVGRSN